MKANKCQALLLLYEQLLIKGCFQKKDYLSKVEISDITFKRYVSELRCYFANFEPDKELVYRKRDDTYYLLESRP
jgi:hypothetical protein